MTRPFYSRFRTYSSLPLVSRMIHAPLSLSDLPYEALDSDRLRRIYTHVGAQGAGT
jgi:hypothetical protein